jgi:hypothetical protein
LPIPNNWNDRARGTLATLVSIFDKADKVMLELLRTSRSLANLQAIVDAVKSPTKIQTVKPGTHNAFKKR